ncbi:hypothetical protein KGF54_004507 [Candida jiufengensis]|uniref:uncharacterized protein n=1 Tax=Candida jiufengensis TaxID=497108 RepID=UPI002224B3D2|nr:uncharacterized protein KGF54_004507 [Candida jiufengensis]KAI5951433.1 hypothetical protein KGF54_004507 [Candida jiufengensis]
MHPSISRLASQQIRTVKIVPQYKYYIRRIRDVAVWGSGLFAFFVWPSAYVYAYNIVNDVPQGKGVGNRGLFY